MRGLDQSNFSRLRERLVDSEDLAQRFFDAIVKVARARELLSSEHLTVDGTLIEAWAGAKSFKPKDGPPPALGRSRRSQFPRRAPRTNDTHASTTDPEAKSARKGKGKEAKLCFGGHALMENRNGLCVDIRMSSALETETARPRQLLKRQRRKRLKPTSAGRRQGLPQQGISCAFPAPPRHPPAHGADRRAQHARAGCTHHASCELQR